MPGPGRLRRRGARLSFLLLPWSSSRRGPVPPGFRAVREFDGRFALRRRLLCAIGPLLLTLGCAEHSSTQIVVLMDTDYAVPGEVDGIRARVSKMVPNAESSAEVETWTHVFSVSGGASNQSGTHDLPATFSVLPDAGSDLEIMIEVVALASSDGRALVSRRVRTRFAPGETLLVRMLLYRACAKQVCAAGESCGCPDATSCMAPSCMDETVSPDVLERIDNPGLLPSDAGIPVVDAGVPDGNLPDDGGPDSDGGVPDGGVIDCEPPLLLCGTDCVNPQADPRYCGDCNTSCTSGFVCQMGICIDLGDCRTNGVGCSGFTYCEEGTGECLPGCAEASQCLGEHEVCDTSVHECVCARDFERCEGLCVDTQIDPRYCGDCTRSCPPGEVCEAGVCDDPGDCRTNDIGCSGLSYCDDATGDCLFGCDDNAQCTEANQICDMISHDCVCAPGFHRCGGTCASDLDVNTCGGSCSPCPAPPNSTPECNAGVCDFTCDADYERCGSACCSLCTCEDEGIECGSGPPCNTSLFCGTCDDPMAPLCSGGKCVCGDDYEQNEDPSHAALLACGDACSLAGLDIQVQGTLGHADDYDFYRIEVGHHHNKAVRVAVSGLQNAHQILLTYVCPDGSDRVRDCSGSSSGLYGRTYCVEDSVDTLELTQNCGPPSGGIATIIVGVSASGDGFIGPCDAYDITVSSF